MMGISVNSLLELSKAAKNCILFLGEGPRKRICCVICSKISNNESYEHTCPFHTIYGLVKLSLSFIRQPSSPSEPSPLRQEWQHLLYGFRRRVVASR